MEMAEDEKPAKKDDPKDPQQALKDVTKKSMTRP
jgi:hypothetical protein